MACLFLLFPWRRSFFFPPMTLTLGTSPPLHPIEVCGLSAAWGNISLFWPEPSHLPFTVSTLPFPLQFAVKESRPTSGFSQLSNAERSKSSYGRFHGLRSGGQSHPHHFSGLFGLVYVLAPGPDRNDCENLISFLPSVRHISCPPMKQSKSWN